jgi:hypothetical protein
MAREKINHFRQRMYELEKPYITTLRETLLSDDNTEELKKYAAAWYTQGQAVREVPLNPVTFFSVTSETLYVVTGRTDYMILSLKDKEAYAELFENGALIILSIGFPEPIALSLRDFHTTDRHCTV